MKQWYLSHMHKITACIIKCVRVQLSNWATSYLNFDLSLDCVYVTSECLLKTVLLDANYPRSPIICLELTIAPKHPEQPAPWASLDHVPSSDIPIS